MSSPPPELRGLATWISRQSKNSLEAAAVALDERGVHLELRHFTADPRSWRRIPIAVGKYLALLVRVLTTRYDFLLLNPADTWLRRPLALRGLLFLARLRHLPVVARWGNPDWIYRNKTSLRVRPRRFRRICRTMSTTAVANLVLTDIQGQEVQAWVGFRDYDVIGNCKGVEELWTSMEREPPPTGLVVNVASVQPLKGPDIFVRVAHEIVTTTHPDARFVWLGGIATPEVRSLIEALGVSGSVEFRRRMFPPYALLQQATVMLFPSRSEAFGLAVAEALACGLPTICFEGTGPAEVIGDGGTAVEMESVTQASDAVRAYLDRTDHQSLSVRCRARYHERYAPEPFAQELARVLRHHVSPREPARRPRGE